MMPRVGLALFAAVAIFAVPCSSYVCQLCTCIRGAEDVVIGVSCEHMSMQMYGIPDIPSTTITLDLTGHAISSITVNDFSHLTELEVLLLADNDIQEVEYAAFSSLSKLRTLDLHGNAIAVVSQDTFHGLTALEELDLSDNRLTAIYSRVQTVLPQLTTLDLSDNPLNCDCGIAWATSFSVGSSRIKCAAPPPLEGRYLDEVALDNLGCVVPSVFPVTTEVRAHLGVRVVLSCSVEGAPASELLWVFEGEVLSEVEHNVKLLSNGSVEIVSMTAVQAGEYTCVSSNMAGTSNATIMLTYLGVEVPHILVPPTHTHAFPGEQVVLSCIGDYHTTSYEWMVNGEALVTSARVTVVTRVGLNISRALITDSGLYTCVAMGTHGSVQASAFVNVTGPLLSCQGVIDASTVDAIRDSVVFAFNQSSLATGSSPHQLLRRLKLPDNASIDLLVAGEVFHEVVQMVRLSHQGDSEGGVPMLSECELNVLAELSGCLQHTTGPDCSDSCYHSQYRSIDGSCNNWNHPEWGMTDSPFQRLLAPAYEDGLGLPVGWSGDRPSARLVSQSVIRASSIEPDLETTHMIMQLGQFLDHDIDLAPGTPSDIAFSSGATCSDQCSNSPPCFPIPVPDDDPRLATSACIPFTRSGGVCGTGPTSLLVGSSPYHREQLNAITSFMDASMIYGSSSDHAHQLQDPERPGWLLEGEMGPAGKPFLPFDSHSLIECSTGIHVNRSDCFLAGDVRTNEQVGLTTMHTVFFREHNRVASFLSHANPHWSQETIYQETREVVIAEWQNIIFSEYLPKILGPAGMAILGDYHGYDPDVNPTIANAFATAAYRFGHGQIQPVFQRLNESYQPIEEGHLLLRDAFFAPFRLLEEGGIDPMLRGLLASPSKKRSSISGLNSNLTEALFQQSHQVALDLAALNIQRGRDHGLPSYLEWRQFCGLDIEYDPLADIDTMVHDMLSAVYGEDLTTIDLWVGGLLETPLPGSQLGPTFACIIAQQFRRLRAGDRFWFERNGQFTPDQLVQLKRASLSRIICDNADSITRVPREALTLQPVSEFSECSDLPRVDLNLWRDCHESGSGVERRSVLMSAVADEVQQLRAAVRELQNSASSCVVNDVKYRHTEEWYIGANTHCSCQMGAVTCRED